MKNKELAIELIQKKLNNIGFLTYKEIASITDYHPKYILKLKKEIEDGIIKIEHGNKGKISKRAISNEEEEKIVNLYKRSHASINQFCRFYGKRSYSCVYGILERNGLVKEKRM